MRSYVDRGKQLPFLLLEQEQAPNSEPIKTITYRALINEVLSRSMWVMLAALAMGYGLTRYHLQAGRHRQQDKQAAIRARGLQPANELVSMCF